ncbi:hypothetical protein TNCV_1454711 [Trichonephila clavipes]|nr:hypothetical protein TNCV_1454711 [Trichonephila clavipes]
MFRIESKQIRSITPIKRYGRDIRMVMVKNSRPFLFLLSLPMKNYHRVEQVKSVHSQSPHTLEYGDSMESEVSAQASSSSLHSSKLRRPSPIAVV